MSQPILTQLTVLDLVPFGNTRAETGFFALRLTPPEWKEWSPGQFVMLRPAGAGSEILWGRPFSICRVTSRDLVIFFQVKGRATLAMAGLQPGDVLNVWGPLGNSFVLEPKTPTLLLAGGIGIAPFVGYVHAHPSPWDVTMEFGHRMPLECYPFDSINEKAMADAHLEKDAEDREKFLALVDDRVRQFSGNGLVLACGPTPFLKQVQSFALKYGARTQLCLETRMACGVGACLGCVVRATLPQDDSAPLIVRSNPTSSATNAGSGAADAVCGATNAGSGAADAVCGATNAGSGAADGGARREGAYVQTCTCGPNFWADSVTLE